MRVEEDEAGLVPFGREERLDVRDQASCELVVGQHVKASSQDEARAAGLLEGVQQVPGDTVHSLGAGPDGPWPGEGMQVAAPGVVQLQGGGERVEDLC